MDMWTAQVNADLAFREFVRERRLSACRFRVGGVSPTLVVVDRLAAGVERAARAVRSWAGATRLEAPGPNRVQAR